jgi:Icc-related predicted phosphoesterase
MRKRAVWRGWILLLMGSRLLMAQPQPVELKIPEGPAFRFVAYGDTRFTDPGNARASNPEVRRELVRAIAEEQPSFVSIGGDITHVGADINDWKVWDRETVIWRERAIPVFPVLGNHDLKDDEKTALANYFARFAEIKNNRYYSVRAANLLMLVLDSSLDETSGEQGAWLRAKLDSIPAEVDFALIVLHHPPYTSSSDEKAFGGGHSARLPEQNLARMLEERQPHTRARIVVISGHVHNYERHQHGGIPYFVTGGGGAHAYPIERRAGDLFQSKDINYHYLLGEIDGRNLKITMHRLEMKDGRATWTVPDSLTIAAPAATATNVIHTSR